jgi:tripartite-type tricarboxylate transporter receptor subunit TctC
MRMTSIRGASALLSLLYAVTVHVAPATAQASYPDRPIRFVVGYAAGGLTDVTTRLVAERMSRDLGQPIIIENKTGAATGVASTAVAQSDPDGYTVLLGTPSLAINPTLQPGWTPKDPMNELSPVGLMCESPFVLMVSSGVPAKTLDEFVALAKAKPGQLNVASSGNGSVNHLILEMFNRRAGVQLAHIPYRGAAPAVVDIIAGRLDATFATPQDVIPVVEQKAARVLAVTSAEPISLFPDAPSVARLLPGFRSVFWQALFVRAGTPSPIVERLAAALRVALEDPALRAKMKERGVTVLSGGPRELGTLLADETKMWGDVIRSAGLRSE